MILEEHEALRHLACGDQKCRERGRVRCDMALIRRSDCQGLTAQQIFTLLESLGRDATYAPHEIMGEESVALGFVRADTLYDDPIQEDAVDAHIARMLDNTTLVAEENVFCIEGWMVKIMDAASANRKEEANPHQKTSQDYCRYQLQWMLDHGYTLSDLMRELEVCRSENPGASISELFADWEQNSGFGSEIWACEDEWRGCEGAE